MVDGADEATKNELSLSRGHLGLEHTFSDKIKGKFLLDFFSREDVAQVSNNGAGIKLKLAYVEFSDYLWKDAKFTFGLMKTYFGTLYDWNYTTIDLSPSDMYGFITALDYGMGISGLLPKGFGEYHLAAYNGEGYAKTGNDIDTNLAFLGNLRLMVNMIESRYPFQHCGS